MRAALDTLLAALGAHAPEYKAALADYLTAKVHCVVCTTCCRNAPLSDQIARTEWERRSKSLLATPALGLSSTPTTPWYPQSHCIWLFVAALHATFVSALFATIELDQFAQGLLLRRRLGSRIGYDNSYIFQMRWCTLPRLTRDWYNLLRADASFIRNAL